MNYAGIVVLFLICGLLPFILGFLPVQFMRTEHKSLTMVWVCGWLEMLALCVIVVVPFVVLQEPFTLTANVFSGVLAVFGIVSLICSRKDIKNYFSFVKKQNADKKEKIDYFALGLRILVLVLILAQLVASVFMQYLDGDDSFFIAASVTTQYTNKMYIYNPYMGAHGALDIRHALSPVPIFLSWLSNLSGIQVTVMCHTFISIFLITLRYCVVYLLAKELFDDAKRQSWLFMLFVNIWYLFGNVSIYAAESFAYTRTWQGKSIFPNVIVPCIFVFLLMISRNKMYPGEWCMVFILTLAGICTTSIAIFLIPILFALAVLCIAIKQRRPVVLAQSLACLLPSAFFGMLYLFLK